MSPTDSQTSVAPYRYPVAELGSLLQQMLYGHASAAAPWLEEKKAALNNSTTALAVAFAAMPRKVGKHLITAAPEAVAKLQSLRPHFSINGWTADRLGRVWLLLQLDATDKVQYLRRIESLFPAAEMNELVALYSALPLLAYPEAWVHRCTEGIRSNIGPVLEAIMIQNPFPSEQLPQSAWNQLVLKAFFTEKRVDQITGLDERANEALANTLLDFAHERWAAGRTAPPLLWRLVAPFLNDKNVADLQRAFYSEHNLDNAAAALACAQTHFAPAKNLLAQRPDLKAAIENGTLTWASVAEQAAGA